MRTFKGAAAIAPHNRNYFSLLHFPKYLNDRVAKRIAGYAFDIPSQIAIIFRIGHKGDKEKKDAEQDHNSRKISHSPVSLIIRVQQHSEVFCVHVTIVEFLCQLWLRCRVLADLVPE